MNIEGDLTSDEKQQHILKSFDDILGILANWDDGDLGTGTERSEEKLFTGNQSSFGDDMAATVPASNANDNKCIDGQKTKENASGTNKQLDALVLRNVGMSKIYLNQDTILFYLWTMQ